MGRCSRGVKGVMGAVAVTSPAKLRLLASLYVSHVDRDVVRGIFDAGVG